MFGCFFVCLFVFTDRKSDPRVCVCVFMSRAWRVYYRVARLVNYKHAWGRGGGEKTRTHTHEQRTTFFPPRYFIRKITNVIKLTPTCASRGSTEPCDSSRERLRVHAFTPRVISASLCLGVPWPRVTWRFCRCCVISAAARALWTVGKVGYGSVLNPAGRSALGEVH